MEPISSCSGAKRDKGESRREVLMKNYGCAPKKNTSRDDWCFVSIFSKFKTLAKVVLEYLLFSRNVNIKSGTLIYYAVCGNDAVMVFYYFFGNGQANSCAFILSF